eukprot:Awhi_evm1s12636
MSSTINLAPKPVQTTRNLRDLTFSNNIGVPNALLLTASQMHLPLFLPILYMHDYFWNPQSYSTYHQPAAFHVPYSNPSANYHIPSFPSTSPNTISSSSNDNPLASNLPTDGRGNFCSTCQSFNCKRAKPRLSKDCGKRVGNIPYPLLM